MKRLLILASVLLLAACGNAGVSGDKFVGHWISANKRWIAVHIEKFGDHYKVSHVDLSNGASGGYVASFEKDALVAQNRYGVYFDPKTDTIELNYYGRFKRASAPDKNSKPEISNLVEVVNNNTFASVAIDPDIRVDSNGMKYVWLVFDYKKPQTNSTDNVTYMSTRNYLRVSCRDRLYQDYYVHRFSKGKLEGELVSQSDLSSSPMKSAKPGLLDDVLFKRVCGLQ